MGACSSRDFENEDSKSSKSSKYIAAYGTKNFSKALRYNDSDIILFAYNGDILSIKTAMLKKEMPQLLSIRGFSQMVYLNGSE
jgi:hypothetical protein